MVDQLANYYAANHLPVVFLEMDLELNFGNRFSRFTAAYTGSSVALPITMVDGGHQYKTGSCDYYNAYKAMVDTELARPPQADVRLTTKRVGDHLVFDVVVKNLSGVTLSAAGNSAAVTVIVYEDTDAGLTNRLERAVVWKDITTPLNHDATAGYSLQTSNLTGVDWTKLHSVAVVEYRPGGTTGAYDMLQAAIASPPSFSVQPASVTILVDAFDPQDQTVQVNVIGGPSTLVWTASTNQDWLSVDPVSDSINRSAIVQIDSDTFERGTYNGTITFTASATGVPQLQQVVPVQVIMTDVFDTFLPVLHR